MPSSSSSYTFPKGNKKKKGLSVYMHATEAHLNLLTKGEDIKRAKSEALSLSARHRELRWFRWVCFRNLLRPPVFQ